MNNLELKPIKLDPQYSKMWQADHYSDFCQLYKNGEKVNDSIYRVGGFGCKLKDKYFMILKYTEAYYDDSIEKDEKKKRHLEGCWCILNNEGVEKVNFKASYMSPYITGGCVYSLDSKYYNIETGELYGTSYTCMRTENFIFLENPYDDDKSKRGVLKINKNDGTFELFK